MAMKDFNVQQFLLEKGERVALWSSVGLLTLLTIVGVVINGLMGGSASATTDELHQLREKGQNALVNSQPPLGLGDISKEILSAGELPPVDPAVAQSATNAPYFIAHGVDDNKWRIPEVLAPDEFQVDLTRTLIRSYIFNQKNQTIMFLQPKATKEMPGQPPREMRRVNPILIPNVGRGMPGQPGQPGMPGQPGQPGQQPIPIPQTGEQAQVDTPRQEMASRWVPVDRLIKGEKEDGTPAETTVPFRMAVIQGAFPYRKQVEMFRRALRYDSIQDMERDANAPVEFLGLNVQRRMMLPDGTVLDSKTNDGWKDLDVINNLRTFLAFGTEPEEAQLLNSGVVWRKDRLVVPRPLLTGRDSKYPACQLKGIQETLAAWEKADRATTPPPFKPKSKFSKEIDIFDQGEDKPAGAAGEQPGAAPRQPIVGENPQSNPAENRFVPEKCLVRFIDIAIAPGFIYEYRIQVQMANPLHGRKDVAVSADLTKEKEIVGPWALVPQKVAVTQELYFYAVDDPSLRRPMAGNPDRTWLQIHRWLDRVRANPKQRDSETPVGDWSVAEQVPVVRGEYLGRFEEVEVPVWLPTLESFVFTLHPEDFERFKKTIRQKQHKGIPVDFSTAPPGGLPALLVDFRGGRQDATLKDKDKEIKVQDTSRVEMLVMTHEGQLLVRNSRDDTDSKERKDRVDAWKAWLKDVKENVDKKRAGPSDPFFNKGGENK